MRSAKRRRLPLRAEASTLFAGLLALFVLLSSFTYFGYRSTVAAWHREARDAAERWGQKLAELVSESRGNLDATLARSLPPGARAALFDERGNLRSSWGHARSPEPLPDDLPLPLAQLQVLGPDGGDNPAISVLVPLPGDRSVLRLDLPAAELWARKQALNRLTPWVVVAGLAAIALFAAFSRALLQPYDRLVQTARTALGADSPEANDEELLLSTLDRALGSLQRAPAVAQPAEVDWTESAGVRAEEIQSGFLLLDGEGRVLLANERARELLGLERDPAGQPVAEALANHPALVQELETVLRSGRGLPRAELELARRDGSSVQLGLVVEPLRRASGEVRGTLVLLADLGHLLARQREARLLETLGELGELAAGVAHELRNGLATVSGQLELLSRTSPEGELLSEARAEVAGLARVVSDFLALARPGRIELGPIDLEQLAARAARDPSLRPPGVEVRIEAPGARIRGDEVLLRRAVGNLLANAVAAQREAGLNRPVELLVGGVPGGVRLRVLDSGPGLPAVDPERLFDPFRSFRPGGSGLGLALARRVASLHGGKLELGNRPEGGVEARLTFPAEQEEP